jgi:hypothetical protein
VTTKRYAAGLTLLAAGAAMVFVVCQRRNAPPPQSHRDRVAIEIVKDDKGVDHARMAFDNFYVHHGSDFLFYTDGCNLVFDTPPSSPEGFFAKPPGSGTSVKVKVGDNYGKYEIRGKCDGLPVESYSPPVIIIDR